MVCGQEVTAAGREREIPGWDARRFAGFRDALTVFHSSRGSLGIPAFTEGGNGPDGGIDGEMIAAVPDNASLSACAFLADAPFRTGGPRGDGQSGGAGPSTAAQ